MFQPPEAMGAGPPDMGIIPPVLGGDGPEEAKGSKPPKLPMELELPLLGLASCTGAEDGGDAPKALEDEEETGGALPPVLPKLAPPKKSG